MTALELRGVTRDFPGIRALDSVDLRVEDGEFVAVIGASGSGKSTLLHIAGTLDRPTTGTVHIGGSDTATLGDAELSRLRGERIGFVFQQFFLVPYLDAVANVALALLSRRMPAAGRRAAAVAALDRVGLAHRLHHRPGRLSGGECQRVAIARALVGGPTVILADEPAGNLDSGTTRDILALLLHLNREGATIVLITHDHELAAAARRQVELRDGAIVRDTGASR
jgi:putative ABC transport system ATP-binding protein